MAKLGNEVALGLHLKSGASDGYLTSAEYIYDQTKGRSLQEAIDSLGTGTPADMEELTTAEIDEIVGE